MLAVQPSRCTECEICMEICSFSHVGENTTKRSRIWVDGDWPKVPKICVCLDCEDRDCVDACPTGALTWDQWVVLDKDACDECGVCEDACPVDGIRMDPVNNLPLICDTCQGEFQCVQWCPTQAVERNASE